MSRRIIILSVLLVAVALVAMSWATMAWFSDMETSSGNSFTAGDMDLTLSDGNEFFKNGISYTWHMTNMVPGSSWYTANMSVWNEGSINADHVELSFAYTLDEGANPESETGVKPTPPTDMAKMIQVTSITYDGHPLDLGLTDENHNGWLDLDDLSLPGNSAHLDDLAAPPPNKSGTETLTMSLLFRPEASNDLQGDILTMVVTATLNQDVSQ